MDNLKQLLIPITLILLFYRPVPVYSAVLDSPSHRVFAQDSNGNWKTLRSSAGNLSIQSGNGGNTVTQVSRLPVPASNGKTYSVDVSRTAAVDLLKVGSALGSLARKLTPVGIALGTASYICQETNICDEAGEWLFSETPNVLSQAPSCSNVHQGSSYYWTNGQGTSFEYKRIPDGFCGGSPPAGFGLSFGCSPSESGCWNGDKVYQRTIGTVPTGTTRPLEQTDWDNAEQILNKPESTDHVLNNGGDVPVDVTTPPAIDNAPISQPIGTTTSTIYDANNNATGTQTKETTLNVTDGATSNAPNQITYNETTIINNYDLNNNLIDSTVTETSAPPPAPPEAPDIDYQFKFDQVSDSDLQDYEFPAVFSQDSWGTGSCPADRSVSYSHGNLELTYQPVCEFAEGIKPAVLVIAGLAAMFIVSGVRTE
jgi:hypothetical protein